MAAPVAADQDVRMAAQAVVGPVAQVVVLAVVVVGVVLHVAVIAREHAPLIAGDLVIEEIAQAGVPVLVKLLVQELVIKAVMILAILHVMTLVGEVVQLLVTARAAVLHISRNTNYGKKAKPYMGS